jgi:hypothetical protein
MTATDCTAAPSATPHAVAEPFAIGAHLVTPRRGYTHHGIYVGGQRVVHYAGWSRASFTCRPVEEVSLEAFADSRGVQALPHSALRYTPADVVARARSRLGEDRYRLASNNCEHFCHWCRTGEQRSSQVERLLGWASSVNTAGARFTRSWLAGGLKAHAR